MLRFEQLQSLLTLCTDPHGPQLYRTLYAMREEEPARTLPSWDAWNALPFITKDIMTATPFEERLFAPRDAIDHVRATSGTSGKAPLFCPRTHLRGMEYRAKYHGFRGAGLVYTVPAIPHWHEAFQKSLGQNPHIAVFDPAHPRASVRIAKALGVDHISLFTFQIPSVMEHIENEGIGSQIQFIEICGQACSRALFERMRTVFPNAVIIPFYGSSEVEDSPIGMPCRPITGEEPMAVYHAKESHYHELLNPDTNETVPPHPGTEAELVVTTYPGFPSAFPLIRYRTGDIVRVTGDCEEHHTWTFTVLGRREMDFVKIPGGVLRADEIERVLRMFPEQVSDVFQLHCYERSSPHGPLFEPVLHVETRGAVDLRAFARQVESLLRTSPSFTYAQGVSEGRYLGLTCQQLDRTPENRKAKRIVVH